jgi:hypothetical protein
MRSPNRLCIAIAAVATAIGAACTAAFLMAGTGALQPLQEFATHPVSAAIVNAIGPIRQLVRGEDKVQRRYLVIVPGTTGHLGAPVQVQAK